MSGGGGLYPGVIIITYGVCVLEGLCPRGKRPWGKCPRAMFLGQVS